MPSKKKNFFSRVKASKSPIIIAELGAKYASISTIKRMIQESKICGADIVKFQTYNAKTISSKKGFFKVLGKKVSQYEFFKKYELSFSDHKKIDKYCRSLKLEWTSTPSHNNDVDFLEQFRLPFYKTGSDDLTNIPFLRYLASKNKPLVISTGMSTLKEINNSVNEIVKMGNEQIILLHCIVSYPSRNCDANLNAIETLKKEFGFPVGLSDHTQDDLTSIVATTMGAKIIEKHFTLDYSLKLADYQASLDPANFKKLVERVRAVHTTFGNGKKVVMPIEKQWRKNARKSIFYAKDIKKDALIKEDHLVIRRPGSSLNPNLYDSLIGKRIKKNVKIDQSVKISDFK